MDPKELHAKKQEKSIKFSNQAKTQAEIQIKRKFKDKDFPNGEFREQIQWNLNQYRGKQGRLKQCRHFEGNGQRICHCSHEKAINKVKKRIERQQISKDL